MTLAPISGLDVLVGKVISISTAPTSVILMLAGLTDLRVAVTVTGRTHAFGDLFTRLGPASRHSFVTLGALRLLAPTWAQQHEWVPVNVEIDNARIQRIAIYTHVSEPTWSAQIVMALHLAPDQVLIDPWDDEIALVQNALRELAGQFFGPAITLSLVETPNNEPEDPEEVVS